MFLSQLDQNIRQNNGSARFVVAGFGFTGEHENDLVNHLNQELGMLGKSLTLKQRFTAWISLHGKSKQRLGIGTFLKKIHEQSGTCFFFPVVKQFDLVPVDKDLGESVQAERSLLCSTDGMAISRA